MIQPLISCAAFSGHRTYNNDADQALHALIEELYAEGVRTFLCGMAVGFDLAAAEAVLACRERLPDVRLVAVVPFVGQQLRFPAADRDRYRQVLDAAAEVITLAQSYHVGCYASRNDFLVDHAATLVTWYDGSSGGTHYTVNRALRRGRVVRNLHPSGLGNSILQLFRFY